MKPTRDPVGSLRHVLMACSLAFTCAAISEAAVADSVAPVPVANKIALKIAWMRPAAAGMPDTKAYVDIVNDSDIDLELVGASTPFAKTVEIVQVPFKNDIPETKVVTSMPVPGGKTTRLAYNGSHLRLVEITKDMGNGTKVPLALMFKTPDGKDVTVTVDAQVRGLLLPQQMPAAMAKDPEPAAKDAPPAIAK